jgi:thioredoxin reductase (NADPH)
MQEFFSFSSIKDEYDVVVLGGGPAGCMAAVYTSRDELSTLILEKLGPGGQMGITAHVDNHPGFPYTISGYELTEKYHQHAKLHGADIRNGFCKSIGLDGKYKLVYVEGRSTPVRAKVVIIATGTHPKPLGLPRESEFLGRGISTCATCDGGFFKDKVVAAVGGGNTAIGESVYLARFVKKVYLIHRRDDFKCTKIALKQAEKNDKIEILRSYAVTSIDGYSSVETISVKNLKTGAISCLTVDGLFIFIGQTPNTEEFKEFIDLDENGYIIADEDTLTRQPGVYAAGDVRAKEFHQIATAVSDGVVAAKQAIKFIQDFE